jgi:hypothetical protein
MATTLFWNSTDIKKVATTGTQIIISNVYRPLRKPVTRHKVEIPGRPGAWDFGDSTSFPGVERDYTVSVDLTITANRSSDVMACAAAIDSLLAGKEKFYFSDSTSTIHTGQIFSEIDLIPEEPGNVARATLIFECDNSTT